MSDHDADRPLVDQVLDVYESRDGGWWNPEHGDVRIPDGWKLLPSGDAYLTRTVKQLGAHWLAWQPRSGKRRHRRRIGVWAPADHIDRAHQMAAETADRRAAQRQRSAERRERQEADYQDELADAIVVYLDFADEHTELARQIAEGAATTASQVGSGRVGRTRTLDLDERARLAATAYIRHRHTDYEGRLIEAQMETGTVEVDDDTYGRIRRDAAGAVDDFIDRYRNPSA